MDIFSTNVLAKVVERLHTPSSFLLDTFFPNVQTSDKEEIFFDVTDSKPRISPFVSPLLPGKVVDSGGYQTKSFKPAYVKDKRRFDANIPYKRVAGEIIGGSLSPSQRYERALATTLTDQLENLTRREEVMAAEILRTGQVVVSGDGYDLNEADAKSLIERGFAVPVKGGQKPATQPQQPQKPDETGGKDDPSSQKGGGQPV